MRSKTWVYAALIPLLLVGGCIVGDKLTTLTIHPDGSADLVVFSSNLRSTQKGDEAERELADYRARFEARAGDEFARIREAGGELVEASWVREQAPFANFVRAHFPNASVLEEFWTERNDDQSLRIATQFHSDGSRRRLTIRIAVSPDDISSFQPSPVDAKRLRQKYADGISETRIAVTRGSINAARGFTVAGDRQSAVANVGELAEILRKGEGKAELYLEWDVAQ